MGEAYVDTASLPAGTTTCIVRRSFFEIAVDSAAAASAAAFDFSVYRRWSTGTGRRFDGFFSPPVNNVNHGATAANLVRYETGPGMMKILCSYWKQSVHVIQYERVWKKNIRIRARGKKSDVRTMIYLKKFRKKKLKIKIIAVASNQLEIKNTLMIF